jgi:transcriptional regulator with XRE-family HTH domain
VQVNCQAGHLSDRQIAAATGVQPSTVRDWLTGRSAPTGPRADRLIELAEITDRLARVTPSGAVMWAGGFGRRLSGSADSVSRRSSRLEAGRRPLGRRGCGRW